MGLRKFLFVILSVCIATPAYASFFDKNGAGGGGSGDVTAVGTCSTGSCFQSVAQNFVLAGPTSGSGQAAARALVAADIPLLTRSNINWTSLSSDVTATGINWSTLNQNIQRTGINWSSLSSDVQRTGINWNSLANDVKLTGINWDSFWTDSASGLNWGKAPGAAVDYVWKKTATGANWQVDQTGAGGGDEVSVNGGAVTNPNFDSTGTVSFTDTANVITANINWTAVGSAEIPSIKLNWVDVDAQELQRAGINWSSLINDVQLTGINWDAFWTDSASGINWGKVPGATTGYIFTKTAAGVNWQAAPAGSVGGSGTTNEIPYWVNSSTLGALAVATYPSLTELSYVKGVTSAIQTQLNAKDAVTTAGRNLTRSTNDYGLDVEIYTDTRSVVLTDPSVDDDAAVQIIWPTAVTVTRIACSTDTGTATIQFDERSASTPNSAGTDVMTAQLVCDNDEQATTSFTNAGIASRAPMSLDVDAVASAPGTVRIHVEYTIDD